MRIEYMVIETTDKAEAAALDFMSSRGHALSAGWERQGRKVFYTAQVSREWMGEFTHLVAMARSLTGKGVSL